MVGRQASKLYDSREMDHPPPKLRVDRAKSPRPYSRKKGRDGEVKTACAIAIPILQDAQHILSRSSRDVYSISLGMPDVLRGNKYLSTCFKVASHLT